MQENSAFTLTQCLKGGSDFRLDLRTKVLRPRLSENQAHARHVANSAQTEEGAPMPTKPPLNCENQVGSQRVERVTSFTCSVGACPVPGLAQGMRR